MWRVMGIITLFSSRRWHYPDSPSSRTVGQIPSLIRYPAAARAAPWRRHLGASRPPSLFPYPFLHVFPLPRALALGPSPMRIFYGGYDHWVHWWGIFVGIGLWPALCGLSVLSPPSPLRVPSRRPKMGARRLKPSPDLRILEFGLHLREFK